MKKTIIAAACFGLVATQAFAAPTSANLNSKAGRLSYTLGMDIGKNFRKLGVTIDPNAVAQGIQDGLSGSTPKLTKQQMQQTMVGFQKEILAKRAAAFKQLAQTNAQAGQNFLAQNKRKAGVVALANGLQYKVVTPGTGMKPTLQDVVTVEYEGKTINGKVFDSSYKRGKPVRINVKDVIPAWRQALQMMRKGATWMVYAPPTLAYGKRGIGPIGPNQTLIFKVHLIDINKAPAKNIKSNRPS